MNVTLHYAIYYICLKVVMIVWIWLSYHIYNWIEDMFCVLVYENSYGNYFHLSYLFTYYNIVFVFIT